MFRFVAIGKHVIFTKYIIAKVCHSSTASALAVVAGAAAEMLASFIHRHSWFLAVPIWMFSPNLLRSIMLVVLALLIEATAAHRKF